MSQEKAISIGKVCLYTFLSFSIPALASAPPGASLTGELSVTASGAASYQLPLLTPPGSIKPSLALQYSSQAGNGPMGMGWSLGGLSQLSRCPRVKTIDGIDDGVLQFNGNDRLCLDGQRLILVNGTYGANNAEYRTQIDSGLKIVGKGAFSTTTAWFEVRTQDGQVMEYGYTANSRRAITPAGTSTAVPTVWALSKVSDRFTNYYTVSYLLDSGMLYPQTISYAGNTNAGTTPARTLTLTWAAATERPDHLPVYVGGGVSATIKRRLSGITNNANPARYQLHYSTSDAQLSNLTKVEYCPDGSTINCLKVESEYGQAKHPVSGKRTSDPQTILAAFGANQGWGTQDVHPRELADVNGDGRLDIVGFFNDGVYVAFGTASGFSAPAKKLSYFGSAAAGGRWASDSTSPRMVVDINGDGLADIVGFASTGIYVALSTGNGFAPQTLWLSGYGTNAGWANQNTHPRMLADVDGDGLLDMVGFANASVAVALNTRTSFQASPAYSNITSTFTRNSGWTENNKYPRMMADMNGDGRDDIVGFGKDGVAVALSSTSGFIIPELWIDDYYPTNTTHTQDIELQPGNGFPLPFTVTTSRWATQSIHPRFLNDFDGDGLPDIVGISHRVRRANDNWAIGIPMESLGRSPDIYFSKNTGRNFKPPHQVKFGVDDSFTHRGNDPILLDVRAERLAANYSLANVNLDGRGDLIIYDGACTKFRPSLGTSLGAEECLANGFTKENGNWTDKDERIITDRGNGTVDLLGFSPEGIVISQGQAENVNRILAFEDDLGSTEIKYTTLANSSYTKGYGSAYPIVDLQVPLSIVQFIRAPDGIGDLESTKYSYGEYRIHADHGSLGFKWTKSYRSKSINPNITELHEYMHYTEYRQDFPLTGSIYKTQSQRCINVMYVYTPCYVISQEVSDWSVTETGTTADRKVYRPHITKTTEHTWEPAL
ncbi:Repeat domain-containing protein [Halopseudomonas litoralis]|uniref:Repeat domain-containing protein n=1 Tax=Halopseudomonas litoralis TaxID=797277 RepID=A0A1H1QC48_9GAMM|nr:FG-GAP-like repeat-containing protein [Halopseudomonas litoralis]SDS20995.1 Repeat domain-containing protein [Halopseudomonas litoralis]